MSAFSSAAEERKKLLAGIEQSATNQRAETAGFVGDFLKARKTGIYNYLTSIPKQFIFYYAVVFFAVYFFLKTQEFIYQDVVIIISSFIVIYLLNEARRTLYISKMEELKIKLNSIFP